MMEENNRKSETNIIFTILWFGGILALGIVLPIYFTITESGTASWIIKGQAWVFEKLSGTPKWYPVVTGLLTCVLHVFTILGLVKLISLIGGKFKKLN